MARFPATWPIPVELHREGLAANGGTGRSLWGRILGPMGAGGTSVVPGLWTLPTGALADLRPMGASIPHGSRR